MRAAIANGADAVYFGLSSFNARHRAENLDGEQLRQTLEYLHAHNVRGYVAFNTLIFSDELEQAEALIRQIAEAGADAVIVQDLGLLEVIRRIAPTLEVHASTQMTLSDARGIEFAAARGISRAILARELSVAEIGRITAATTTPVEVFCHGALCVAYSGQCLTSESIGGRSANRGQCAQACRLPYALIVDGQERDTAGHPYLLSPQDLAGYGQVDQLMAAGVASLKIEGRLKSAQYVAATTATYREAIEAAMGGEPFRLSTQREEELTQSFSRGFTPGFLGGVDHQRLVDGSFSSKRGVRVGEVVAVRPSGVVVRLAGGKSVKPGDGVVFDEDHPEQDEQGGRIYEVIPAGKGMVELRFGRGALVISAISPGALVWKSDDPAINRALAQSYRRDTVVNREQLTCEALAVVGETLQIHLIDAAGRSVTVASDAPLEAARKFPLDETLLREQMGRLGETPYELGEVKLHGREPGDAPEAVMAPKSVLNEMRRRAVEELLAMRVRRHAILQHEALGRMRETISVERCDEPKLSVLARSLEQVQAAGEWSRRQGRPIGMLWCDFEDVRRYGEAVAMGRELGMPIGLATLRICKPGEDGFLNALLSHRPDAILVRNLSSLSYCREHAPATQLVGDYSLNVANELTARLLSEAGLSRLTPSHDLNIEQLEAMLRWTGGGRFELVLHQHMPMFHMEHCVFAHMLSEGRDHRTCGRPCERHLLSLRDRVGVEHPLAADAGCRNTVFNGRAQSAAGYLSRLKSAGIACYRVELLRESSQQTEELLAYYQSLLEGRDTPKAPRTSLKVLDVMGVTPGTMAWE